jgi:hypothetical protein
MKSIVSKVVLVGLLAFALLFGARAVRNAAADPRSSVAMPVQSLDSNNNILGTATNPVYTVTGSPADGGSSAAPVGILSDAGQTMTVVGGPFAVYQADGGGVANSWAVQVNDGTNVLGTSSHPVRMDPTGVTTQPVSGTVTVVDSVPLTVSGPVVTVQGDGGPVSNSWAVQVNDGTNVLGTTSHPVIGAGAGTAGSPSGGVESVQGVSGGTALPSDTVPGDLINSVADVTAANTQGQVKTSTGTFVTVNACNEGTVTGWLMFYDHGGSAPDAGAMAGTAPKFMGIRVPAGACTSLSGPRSFTNGIFWYSSATVSTLTTASAPNFTAETFYR